MAPAPPASTRGIEPGEHARPVDLGVTWEPNAQVALLVQSDYTACLVLRPHFDDPDRRFVLLEWRDCDGALLGSPNDEGTPGHRLWNRGLRDCPWAAEVDHSSWLADCDAVARAHPRYQAGRSSDLRHFVLKLKGETFEVIASDVVVHRIAGPPIAAAAGVLGLALGPPT